VSRCVARSPVVGEHHGHVVGRHTGEPACDVDGGSVPGLGHQLLHRVTNLPLSGTLVGSVHCGREQIRAGNSPKLAPVLSVWRGGHTPDIVHQSLWSGRERCVVLLEQVLGCLGSGHHETWLLTCKLITSTITLRIPLEIRT
jgi:hypothetical protein